MSCTDVINYSRQIDWTAKNATEAYGEIHTEGMKFDKWTCFDENILMKALKADFEEQKNGNKAQNTVLAKLKSKIQR